MTTRTVPVGLQLRADHYRALTGIATAKGVQVHTLIEGLVTRALTSQGAPVERKPIKLLSRAEQRGLGAKIRELHAEGLTDRGIARELGLERDAVCQRRIAMKLPVNPERTRHRPADPERVRALHAEQLNDAEIAARLGTTQNRVQRVRADVLHLPTNDPRGRKQKAADE